MTRLATRNHSKEEIQQSPAYYELITFYNKLDKQQREEFRHYLEQMKGEKIILSRITDYLVDLSQDNYAKLIVHAKLLLIS